MTYQVIRQTTCYNAAGTKILSRDQEVVAAFDTAGFALANADHLRRHHHDTHRDIVTQFINRHASGRVVNETEAMWREMCDDATLDRIFPEIELSF